MGYFISINDEKIVTDIGSRKRQEKTLYTFGIEAPLPSQLFRELADTSMVLQVCLSPMTDIRARVQALRDGAVAVFPVPVDVGDIATKLKELTAAGEPDQHRIMVVDDHNFHAKLMVQFLESAGMQTIIVRDSLKVMDTLESFNPDLLLMDLYMPEIRGDELASLIRNSGKYNAIPIVFVSGEASPNNFISKY